MLIGFIGGLVVGLAIGAIWASALKAEIKSLRGSLDNFLKIPRPKGD